MSWTSRALAPRAERLRRARQAERRGHEISLSPIETADGLLVSSAIRDVTEHKRVAKELDRFFALSLDLLCTFSAEHGEARGPVDLHRVLESMLAILDNEIRHRAREIRRFGKVPLVLASEARLGQVLLNLVLNAAQAIPVGKVDANEIRIVTGTDASDRAFVEISDTGEGMSPEVLARRYQPFFTTEPVGAGTGLGLSLSHRIITELGGSVSIESRLGHGTIARVDLPPAPERVSSPLPMEDELKPAAAPRRASVLVIDDDALVGRVLGRVLSPHHDVVVLADAREALVRLQGGERFDVIFCDLMMPEMSGMAFHEALRVSLPAQCERIVFMTGGVFTGRAGEFLATVPNATVAKPFAIAQILAMVQTRIQP
jgi:CheY-like chemotaxis protein